MAKNPHAPRHHCLNGLVERGHGWNGTLRYEACQVCHPITPERVAEHHRDLWGGLGILLLVVIALCWGLNAWSGSLGQ